MTPHDKALQMATYARLKEHHAQMGEPFTLDMFTQLAEGNPELYEEELVETHCAVKDYLNALLTDAEVVERVKATIEPWLVKVNGQSIANEVAQAALSAISRIAGGE